MTDDGKTRAMMIEAILSTAEAQLISLDAERLAEEFAEVSTGDQIRIRDDAKAGGRP